MIKPLSPMPRGWKYELVDNLAKRGSGHTPDREKAEYWNGGVKWVSLADSDRLDRQWIRETTSEISNLGIRHSSAVMHPMNTVILSRDAGVGKSAVLAESMAVSQHFIAWNCGPNLVPFMLYYWLQCHKEFFERMAVGSTIQTIGLGVFRKLAGTFPPLPEQRKIADILSTWDDALTQLDALIEAQERRKKALMQQLLTGKKRFPAFAKKPWKKVRMGEVLKRVFRPIDWSAEMSLSLVSLRRRCGGLFRRPDVLGADYKTQDLHELHADDFLISKRQVAHGAWGIVTPEFAGSHVSKEYAILVNAAPAKLHMPFFAWLCQTPRMIRLSRVASTGVHIEKLIFDPVVFLRDSIRIPSDLEEQRQIAAILDTADHQLTLLRTQRTALEQQKRGLMQRLLTGKLRVKP